MKSTGVTRQIDELGRIVLPVELRRNLNLRARDRKTGEGDHLEIFVEDERIILQKHNPGITGCIFCGSVKNTVEWKQKKICTSCAKAISK